jgi:hypothetical protein
MDTSKKVFSIWGGGARELGLEVVEERAYPGKPIFL